MTPEQLHCYTEEVWLQATIALYEYDGMLSLLKHPQERQNRFVWVHLQAFLAHAGMGSKLFWPIRKTSLHQDRGREIRDHLEVNDSSPLYDRSARNAIEHLDER